MADEQEKPMVLVEPLVGCTYTTRDYPKSMKVEIDCEAYGRKASECISYEALDCAAFDIVAIVRDRLYRAVSSPRKDSPQ